MRAPWTRKPYERVEPYAGAADDEQSAPSARTTSTPGRILGFLVLVFLMLSVALSTAYAIKAYKDTEELLKTGTEECPDCAYYVDVELPADLERRKKAVIAAAGAHEPVSWSTYHADPGAHAGYPVELRNADFVDGTLRFTTTGYFYLAENVVFAPNADNGFQPYANQSEYAGVAYSLGFFAAVTFEAPNIVFDLRGFTMVQSTAHALHQRFYAHVELGEAPFLGGQGPAAFAPEASVVDGATVMNGVLGRSAHHGVHGNTGDRVLVQDLIIRDYEVAAVALNGFRGVVVENIRAEGTFRAVPVTARWSTAHFLKPFIALALELSGGANPAEEAALEAARDALLALEADVVQDLVTDGLPLINATAHPAAAAAFSTGDGVFDGGSAYGMVFYPVGQASFGFVNDPARARAWETRDILLRNVHLGPTVVRPVEVVALRRTSNSRLQIGPVGDVVRVAEAMDGAGNYVPEPVTEGQLALAALVAQLSGPQQAQFNTLHVDPETLDWRAGAATMADLVAADVFRYARNGDSMRHVTKGAIGLRADGVQRMCVRTLHVASVQNLGGRAQLEPLPGETEVWYLSGADGGHELQGAQRGYMGSDARGLAFAGSTQVAVKGATVEHVSARYGFAYGAHVFNYALSVNLEGLILRNISTLVFDPPASEHAIAMGPKVGHASGVVVDDTSSPVCHEVTVVEDVHTDYVSLASTRTLGCSN